VAQAIPTPPPAAAELHQAGPPGDATLVEGVQQHHTRGPDRVPMQGGPSCVAFLREPAALRMCQHAPLLGVQGFLPTPVYAPADTPTTPGAVGQRDGPEEASAHLPTRLAWLRARFARPRFIDRTVVRHLDEAKASRTTGLAVGHNPDRVDAAIGLEELTEALLRGGKSQVTHKDIHATFSRGTGAHRHSGIPPSPDI
jgi:hypothetical protein